MGMFDWIDYECVCPVCYRKVTNFQSKSSYCSLALLKPSKVNKFYTDCENCGVWIEFTKKGGEYERIVTGKNNIDINKHTKMVKIG